MIRREDITDTAKFQLSTKASFILLFKKGTPEEDLHIANLNGEFDLSIKIIYTYRNIVILY